MAAIALVTPAFDRAAAFDAFWARYPRKQAKKDAEKAWTQAHVTPEMVAAIHLALDWQLATWDDVRYVPLPATWIRGERWTDEPISGPKRSGSSSSGAPESAFVRQHRLQVESIQQQNAGFDATQRLPREEWGK